MKYKDFEGEVEDLVNSVLDDVERAESLRIPHAVESGSRSWDFASPDSDYDVRFVYVRRLEDYLTIKPKRKDTIEWVVDEGPRIPEVDAFIDAALARYGEVGSSMPKDGCKDWEPLEDLFHALVLGS